jgi:hypothetical protein
MSLLDPDVQAAARSEMTTSERRLRRFMKARKEGRIACNRTAGARSERRPTAR